MPLPVIDFLCIPLPHMWYEVKQLLPLDFRRIRNTAGKACRKIPPTAYRGLCFEVQEDKRCSKQVTEQAGDALMPVILPAAQTLPLTRTA